MEGVGRSSNNNALSASLRKRWSFDNLLRLSDSGDFSAASSSLGSQRPRVTTALAAVPVSASSDNLDDFNAARATPPGSGWERAQGSDTDEVVGMQIDGLQPSGSGHQSNSSKGGEEALPVPRVLALPQDELGVKQYALPQSKQQEPLAALRRVFPAETSRGGSLDKSGTVHQQLTLRDSAGAMALRKAGTVSPKASTANRKKSSHRASAAARFST